MLPDNVLIISVAIASLFIICPQPVNALWPDMNKTSKGNDAPAYAKNKVFDIEAMCEIPIS